MSHALIHGMPYFPGYARGRLHAGVEPDCIVVLKQQDLPWRGTVPRGFVVVGGAPLSHPLLRLRGLGVPVILIDPEQAHALPWGDTVTLDGIRGRLSRETAKPDGAPPALRPGEMLMTKDGTRIELRTSVGSAAGAAAAAANGASAIGLFRSEWLFPASGARPDAAFLQAALREVCDAAHPLPVTVRLFDIAGDKRPPWFGNPPGLAGVLGLQGARLYNIEPMRSVLYAEFDALAALAPRYPLRVLIPYLTQLEELEYWRGEIAARISLPVGAMLETPAAALAVASWLKTADFAALGCNDLMQCLFASDRDQPELAHLLDPYCPTLYRFLRQVASEAGAASASLQVCGLLAQLPGVLPLLLGLGYRVFSVDPLVIPWLAQASREVSMVDCERKAEAACSARHSREVRALLGL